MIHHEGKSADKQTGLALHEPVMRKNRKIIWIMLQIIKWVKERLTVMKEQEL